MSDPATPNQTSTEGSSLYQPLNRETNEIRIFDLSPGKAGDPITGRLRVVSLNRKPRFDALSYVWGAPEPQTVITLRGGHSVSIGPNLHLALSDLRRRWRPLKLWADALCINQQDDEEKGHQVPLMSRIFREARMMRAWLNQEIDAKCPALRALRWLVENSLYKREVRATPCWSNTIKRRLHMLQEVESHDWNFWKPVTDILENKYWFRLWIQQELIISSNVRFHIRKTEIAGRHLLRLHDKLLLSWLYESVLDADHPGQRLPEGYTLALLGGNQLVDGIKNFNSIIPLIFFVSKSIGLETTKLPDLVYGCLALANSSEISTLRVDYALPISQVYTDVIRNHLVYWKNLDFMLFSSSRDCEEYPTWLPVPDRLPDFEVVMWGKRLELDWLGIPASVSDDGLSLGVQACQLDKVAHTSSFTPSARGVPMAADLQAVSECYLKIHPDSMEGEVWSAECLVDILKWPFSIGIGYDPIEGVQKALWGLLEVAKSGQHAELDWDRALEALARTPAADKEFITALRQIVPHLCAQIPMATHYGRLGLVGCTNPDVTPRETDQVWLVAGCSQPVVLREQDSSPGHFSVIGIAKFAEFIDQHNTRVTGWFQDRISRGEAPEDFTQRIVLV
ncbi:hypothetical protein PG993_014118 [Apiospora rasikravindrae]|uniref:Heterokaryon incompatibility domain-containing protein n=1 Tax=Apiospora rasikravindrae TaxID=990691 RepID=A0ABR1RSC9_9PEZI